MISTQERALTVTPAHAARFGARRTLVDAAILSVVVFAALYLPDCEDTSGAIIGSIVAYPAATVGISALRRSRALPSRSVLVQGRYAVLTLLVGVIAGAANLLINFGLAQLDPRIRRLMVHKVTYSADWSMVVSAPVVEELMFRLVVLSCVVWLLGRFVNNRERIFPIALAVSAVLFSLIHIAYPPPLSDPIMMVHTAAVLVKSAAVGLLLGWIFWRWGLPYSMACHSAANGIYILLAPLFF